MRVLGLVSSPRKGGNSELAVKEMMRALPDDWEKGMLRLNELRIEDCRACYRCLPKGSSCSLQDDLPLLLREIKRSDKVIIAFPAYILTAPGPVKKIMDRLLSVISDHEEFAGRDCVAVLPYGIDGWDGTIKENAIVFANMLRLHLLEARPILATLPGDSVQGENLETLHRLAKLLMEGSSGKPLPTSDALECPHCSSTALKISPNGQLRCAACGGISHLTGAPESGLSLYTVDSDRQSCFTPESKDEHIDLLMRKKQLFLDNLRTIKQLQAEYTEIDLWI